MDKSKLKVGDLIRFYCSGVGGFLFGVIIEYENDFYPGKLNIWRPKNIYFLQECGINVIKVINDIEDVGDDYDLIEFQKFICEVKRNNIFCNYKIG